MVNTNNSGDDGGETKITHSTNDETNQQSSPSSNQINDKSRIEWPFDEKDLYKTALHFFKENEGKAFHPSYDQRNSLIAYTLQEKHGPFIADKAIPLGALDLVGHDRRSAWIALNDMPKELARKKFVELLDMLCPFFRSYLIAVRCDLEEKQRKIKEQEDIQLMEQKRQEEEERNRQEKRLNYEKQKRMIQEMLNRQTINQFTTYARQQYPDSEELQEHLIKQLQEQHFQQYLQQMMMEQSTSNNNSIINPISDQSAIMENMISSCLMNETTNNLCENINQLSINNNINSNSGNNGIMEPNGNQINPNDNLIATTKQDFCEPQQQQQQHEDGANNIGEESEDEDDDDDESNYSKHNIINNASMWTRKDITSFKDSVQSEGGHGVIKVGHGEIATIRVPTHDDGTCIYWEFATDYYDIGFGLLFEWNSSPDNQVSIYFSESEEDEEEDQVDTSAADGHDIEKGTNRLLTNSINGNKIHNSEHNNHHHGGSSSSISVIIPIYRRDSHEEVFAGSHIYPGKGVYLLKFDNSYSLWRSKTLYYRVYYTKEP